MTKNNKPILTLTFALFSYFLFITSSLAECDGFYLAARGGQAKYKLDDDRSGVSSDMGGYVIDKKRFMASGALGYRYKHFRGELEYVWRKKNDGQLTEFSSAKFKSYSYMFVVYYDFFPYFWFSPFVNAGVGYSDHKLNISVPVVDTNYRIKDKTFTWSLGAGITVKVTNRFNVDLGYRYYDMGDFSAFYGKTKMTDQEIYAGLRYVL